MWKKLSLMTGLALTAVILGYQVTILNTWKRSREQTEAEEEAAREAAQLPDMVTKDTRIIIESYDADGNLTDRTEEQGNAVFVGNNRLDMLVYASLYRDEQATEEELRQGLERMVLESYSPDAVTLVKYYGEPEEESGYFIGVRDGVVIVYTRDRSQVYEYTNVELRSLPDEVQQELIDGIEVENEQELFDFLQTYSS